jgi:hypothetical protein
VGSDPLPPPSFARVELPAPAATPRATAAPEPLPESVLPPLWPTATASPDPRPTPVVEPKPQSTSRATPAPKTSGISTTHSVKGKASWYCKPGVSSCHYAHSGGQYAAACGKLRTAMGRHWRGQRVRVSGPGGSTVVTLIDWCGSSDKTIDLYWDAFARVRGTNGGVARVTITW